MASHGQLRCQGHARGRTASPTRSTGSRGHRRRPRRRVAAVLAEGAAGEPAAHRGRRRHHRRRHPGAGRLGRRGRARQGDPVHAGARDHAGLHRRAVHRRPRHHARGDGRPRRRRDQDQPAGAGRDGHRPLRDRRRLRHARGVRAQRRDRVRAQPRALPVPALGPGRLRRLQGRAARAPASSTRSTSSTSPASIVHPRGRRASCTAYPDTCVGTDSHTTMVNGIGVVGWGVGGIEAEAAMLGQPVSHADPARGRLQAHRRAARGLHRHRPGADDHRDAAPARRRRQVRGVLRRGRLGAAAGQPRHHRQHEPGVRLDHRGLPDRRGDREVPRAHRPLRGAARAGRGLRQGAGPLARPRRRAALLREARARPRDRRPVAGRPQAPAGPGLAVRGQGVFRGALADYVDEAGEEKGYDEAVAESFPASDSPSARGQRRGAAEGAARRRRRTAAARATRPR